MAKKQTKKQFYDDMKYYLRLLSPANKLTRQQLEEFCEIPVDEPSKAIQQMVRLLCEFTKTQLGEVKEQTLFFAKYNQKVCPDPYRCPNMRL